MSPPGGGFPRTVTGREARIRGWESPRLCRVLVWPTAISPQTPIVTASTPEGDGDLRRRGGSGRRRPGNFASSASLNPGRRHRHAHPAFASRRPVPSRGGPQGGGHGSGHSQAGMPAWVSEGRWSAGETLRGRGACLRPPSPASLLFLLPALPLFHSPSAHVRLLSRTPAGPGRARAARAAGFGAGLGQISRGRITGRPRRPRRAGCLRSLSVRKAAGCSLL